MAYHRSPDMLPHPPALRRIGSVLVRPTALAALLALAACGGDRASPAGDTAGSGDYNTIGGGPPGGTLVVLADREPDELNPLTFNTYPANQVTHLLFRTLAWRDSTLSGYQPDLARSWELSPDSAALILHLRDDIRWHDGVPVTAEDVVWSLARQQDPAVASPRQPDIAAAGEATALDSFTVRVELQKRGPYAVNSILELMPAPKHLLDSVPPERLRFTDFGRHPVGNGKYRFVSWNAGQTLTVEVDTAAPGPRPAIERVVHRFVPDVNAAITELLAGQGDVLIKVPTDQRERIAAAPNVEIYTAAQVRPAWIAWNTQRPPVDDARVRRALLMGIAREALVEGLLGEQGQPAYSPIPTRLREHSADVRPIPYDTAAAKRLLDAAGWRDSDGDGIRDREGTPLRVVVEYSTTDPVRQDMLIAIQAMLRRIGVDLVPRALESTTWVEHLRGRDFQGSFWGWGWGPGVAGPNAEAVFHSRSIPPGGPNFASYRNPRVDALLDSVQVEGDPTRARAMWRGIEQRLIDDAVYAPIYLDPELYAVNERVENVRFRSIEWWEDLPYWYIPLDQRMPRDRAR
jgi:peptide/nickel transport system substrate-binding protein